MAPSVLKFLLHYLKYRRPDGPIYHIGWFALSTMSSVVKSSTLDGPLILELRMFDVSYWMVRPPISAIVIP